MDEADASLHRMSSVANLPCKRQPRKLHQLIEAAIIYLINMELTSAVMPSKYGVKSTG